MSRPKRYRFYIDESGDHTCQSLNNASRRYLGITACMIENEYYRTTFQPGLEEIKKDFFTYDPDDPLVFHRQDIINQRGPFWKLRDPDFKNRFNQALLDFFRQSEYMVITVVIDKKSHFKRYGDIAWHPYHYCLTAILERYCGFLNFYNAVGDVMAESRGKIEDKQLMAAYQDVWVSGTYFKWKEFFQKVLTSKEIKIKKKNHNIAGLQLADLLAYPCKQEILLENRRIEIPDDKIFGRQVCNCIKGKYNRHFCDGRVKGYGKIFL